MDDEVIKIDAQELDEARRKYLHEEVALGRNVVLKPGPPKDVRMESRRVGPYLMKEVPCRGEHSHFCQVADDGWVCDSACTVVDCPVTPTYEVVNDILIDVEHEVYRRRLRVYWASVRVNQRLTFRNGRCSPAEQVYRRDVWYKGRAWTRRGAWRQICRAEGQR